MMELEIGGQRYPIPTGEAVVGSDPSSAIRLVSAGVLPRHAILSGAPDGSTAVRQAVPEAEVLLNGVRLGAEPSPILHGDKLQIGPDELLCVDPRRSGSTQFVNAADVAKMAMGSRPGAPKPPTASTGGRLVCLTDGREYTIGNQPVVFGREAGCDIVVPNKDVSRRHAEIMATPQGYVVVDSSTNGTFVNGEPVKAQRLLARADVIRVGDHEFRFYADAAPPAPPPPPSPPPAAPEEAVRPLDLMPVEPSAGPPPESAKHRLHDTMYGAAVPPIQTPRSSAPSPAAAPAAGAARPSAATTPALASLLVRSGSLKGTRFPIRVPLVNIGRGDYNDLVIPDESVSTQHAKLSRREEVWMLTDLDSTNGTFVDGERVSGEAALSPGAAIRFGEVSLMFEPSDDDAEVAKAGGTKVLQAAMPLPPPKPVSPPAPPAASAPPAAAPRPPAAEPGPKPGPRKPAVIIASPPPKSGARWLIPVVIVLVVAAVVLALLFR